MNIEEFRDFCLGLSGTEESFPFGEDTLVFKIGGKIYALTSLSKIPFSVNLKCNPEKALELRESFVGVKPGFHMNKKHWNTVRFDGDIPQHLLEEWVVDSYQLVKQGLPQKIKNQL